MKLKTLVAALATVGVGVFAFANAANALTATCRTANGAPLVATNACFYNSATGCSGGGCSCEGSADDDVIIGSKKGDVIIGLGGDDIVVSLEGSDVICMGDGDDFVDAGEGGKAPKPQQTNAPRIPRLNQVRLGGGDDIAVLGGNHSWSHGGRMSHGEIDVTTIFGGAGNDILVGGDGRDNMNGDGGEDFLTGGDSADDLFGGADSDFLSGQEGKDYLDAGEVPVTDGDVCVGGAGEDQAYGCDKLINI